MKPNFSVAEAKELHKSGQSHLLHGGADNGALKAAVLGATDGIITTFAVVAGVAGGNLSATVVLVLGFANLVADGLSMGISNYLSERSEARQLAYQYKIEKWEIENIPDEETKELVAYFRKRGVAKKDTQDLTTIIKKYPALWSELGFIDEMGTSPASQDGPVWFSGFVTFWAFILAGLLPLMPYTLEALRIISIPQNQFPFSILATASALFFVGSLRTFFTKGAWWKNGLEMLSVGAVAATAAYFVGVFIKNLAH